MNIYIRVFGLFFICITSFVAYPQNVTERIILTAESNEAAKNLYYSIGLNQSGDYGFVILKDKSEYFVSGTDTVGPFPVHSHINSVHFSTKVRSSYMIELDSTTNREFYIKNEHNPRYYGKYYGEVIDFEQYDPDFVVIVKTDDTINVFFNDNLLAKLDYKKKERFDPYFDFVHGGGSIAYKIRKNGKEYIYCNNKLIDSTDGEVRSFAINEKGDYIFSARFTDSVESEEKSFSYIHTRDTMVGPLPGYHSVYINRDGGTVSSSTENGKDVYLINGKYFEFENSRKDNERKDEKISFRDSANFIQEVNTADGLKINAKGNIMNVNYEKIFMPCIDSDGNYSLFGLRNYYLYKFTNGIEDTVPLSKYGVRAFPLYISPDGKLTYCHYNNEDSIYVYLNDSVLFQTVNSENNFYTILAQEFFDYNHRNPKYICNDLIYLEADSTGYLLYKGNLSEPFNGAYGNRYPSFKGMIISGELTNEGFYVIQDAGNKSISVDLNNEYYAKLENIDLILERRVFFGNDNLVFYALRGNQIIRYGINEK